MAGCSLNLNLGSAPIGTGCARGRTASAPSYSSRTGFGCSVSCASCACVSPSDSATPGKPAAHSERERAVAVGVEAADARVELGLVERHAEPREPRRELRAREHVVARAVERVVQVVRAEVHRDHLGREPPQRRRVAEQVVLVGGLQHRRDRRPPAHRREPRLRPAAARAHVDEPARALVGKVGAEEAEEEPAVGLGVRELRVDEAEAGDGRAAAAAAVAGHASTEPSSCAAPRASIITRCSRSATAQRAPATRARRCRARRGGSRGATRPRGARAPPSSGRSRRRGSAAPPSSPRTAAAPFPVVAPGSDLTISSTSAASRASSSGLRPSSESAWRTAASDIEPSPCALKRLKTRVSFAFCASLSRCAIDACAAPLADDLADASTSITTPSCRSPT